MRASAAIAAVLMLLAAAACAEPRPFEPDPDGWVDRWPACEAARERARERGEVPPC